MSHAVKNVIRGRRSLDENMWFHLVKFIEEHEYHPLKHSRGSIVWRISGFACIIISFAGGVAAFLAPKGEDILKMPAEFFYQVIVLPAALVTFLMGVVLVIWSLSTGQFVAVGKLGKSIYPWFEFSYVIIFCILSLCVVLVMFGILLFSKGVEAKQLLVQCVSLIVATSGGCWVIGSGTIRIGIRSPRRVFDLKKWAIPFEAASLAFPMVLLTYLVARESTGWVALALAFSLALLGYINHQFKRLDSSFSFAVKSFDNLRSAAIRASRASSCKRMSQEYEDLLGEYRKFQANLASSPSYSRRPLAMFGVQALCSLAAARDEQKFSASDHFIGEHRVFWGDICLNMPERRFCVATAQVFDGMVRMLDSSFTPIYSRKARRLGKVRRNRDLRSCLEDYSISL